VAHGGRQQDRCRATGGGGVGLQLHPEVARPVVVAGVKLGTRTDGLATGVMAKRGSGRCGAWGGNVCMGTGGQGCVKQ
jgi:hypothetical protein